MSKHWNAGKGKAVQWLRDHANYSLDYCLIWPFSRCRGYGQFGYLGKNHYAHKFMCEMVKGPAPSPLHEAAHSCGRGDDACVNPMHLSWKTKSDNQRDCRRHGTQAKSHYGPQGKLTPEQVAEIRSLHGIEPQTMLALRFGVSDTTISNICTGRTRKNPRRYLSDDEVRLIRSTPWQERTAREFAEALGVSRSTIERARQGVHYKRLLIAESAEPRLQASVGQAGGQGERS